MLDKLCSTCIGRTVSIALLLVCLQGGLLFGQWEADFRLTTDNDSSFTSNNNAWSVAVYDDTVHVVWYDNRDGNYEIYYKRSDDGGSTWGSDMRITDEPSWSSIPSLAVSSSNVHVVWEDDRDMDIEVYHKRSTDGGLTWGPDVHVTVAPGPQGMPSVVVIGDYVHVAWVDFTLMGNSEIYYGRSSDGGTTWETPFQISNAGGFSSSPSIVAHESDVHIAWHDSRFGWFNNEIYYRRSTDDGITWGTETRMTEDTTFSNVPSIALSGSNVHVVWEESRDGNYEIYYKRSTDYGQTWGPDTRLTDDTGESHSPSLSASESNVHIVWMESRDGNEEIYYKKSTDNGVTWGGDIRLTDDQDASQNASVVAYGEKLHVVWQDDRDGNWEIYYKRDPTGNTGVAELTENAAGAIRLNALPNPFTNLTQIRYSIHDTGYLIQNSAIEIYDAGGRLVRSFHQISSTGNQESSVVWDGTDQYDRQLGNGVYFVKLEASGISATEKLLLIR
ncbi:MAG: exo-alpha-sialidase [candidate division WOR-3 bacterium]|nr:MAG: exo-alpha-sialidase [candidate division WOR-3 bacterium]